MNFLEVAKGLKEGKVYTYPTFSREEYLFLGQYGEIHNYDGHNTEPVHLTTELILSNEWKICDKETWYVIGTRIETHLINDNVRVQFLLSKKDKSDEEETSDWDDRYLSHKELKNVMGYTNVQIGTHAKISEYEQELLKQLRAEGY